MRHNSRQRDDVRVAVLQMCSTPDVSANLALAESLLEQAYAQGAKLAVLPECFAYLGPSAGYKGVAERLDDSENTPVRPILKQCQSWSKRFEMELLLGGYWERSETLSGQPCIYNALLHLTQAGEIASIYRKIHLFDAAFQTGPRFCESEHIQAGTKVVTSPSIAGCLGLSICYDLRFPRLFRSLVEQGATTLVVPAAFTQKTGALHWELLLRSRAVESQCFVLAAAQWGHHFGPRYSYGHAMVIDPLGTIMASAGAEGNQCIYADINLTQLEEVRRRMPCLTHIRL